VCTSMDTTCRPLLGRLQENSARSRGFVGNRCMYERAQRGNARWSPVYAWHEAHAALCIRDEDAPVT